MTFYQTNRNLSSSLQEFERQYIISGIIPLEKETIKFELMLSHSIIFCYGTWFIMRVKGTANAGAERIKQSVDIYLSCISSFVGGRNTRLRVRPRTWYKV